MTPALAGGKVLPPSSAPNRLSSALETAPKDTPSCSPGVDRLPQAPATDSSGPSFGLAELFPSFCGDFRPSSAVSSACLLFQDAVGFSGL